ncbi:peptidase inhibitor family I36 protein [Streptomyces sp. NPDC006638]|uniref:peptidase inhibitor family I36 protein n=1 Tax=Streptomyces sp. NPDC006638 TaxID=3157183 RepID=UPI0033B28A43
MTAGSAILRTHPKTTVGFKARGKDMRVSMRRRLGLALSGGLLAVGSVGMLPGSAQAAVSDCPNESGYLCFWADPNFSGRMGKVAGDNSNWANLPGSCLAQGWDNCTTSLWNEGLRCEAVVFEHPNYKGANWVIGRDTGVADLRTGPKPSGGTWDDAISSNNWFCG